MMIGKLRSWMKRKIAKQIEAGEQRVFVEGYMKAMEDVAQYFDFPLDDKLWEKW